MSESDRYILAKKINRGGMAEIYLGKHVGEDGFQRLCAIKRILPHYASDKEFIQMFRDEAHICKRLQHANIVRVEGFEEVEGSYAIIMEFVDGSDLRSVLHACEQSKVRMKIPMACYIIAEAARGLHYAHTKVDDITRQPLGIVHRDISPQNIMVSFEGEIKVTDFGIADAESKITETRPGIVKGKYSYMSPEQISAKAIDARTDVFALSIVLWEMLAMRRLFQGQNEVETIQLVKNCKIDKNIRELHSKVESDLESIVLKGLARDPKKRYASAAELEKDLRRLLSRRYPDFTPEDLGTFLNKILEKKRTENSEDIKRTLTETSQKPAKRSSRSSSSSSSKKASNKEAPKQLSIDGDVGPNLNLAKAKEGYTAPKTKSRVSQNRAQTNNRTMGQNRGVNQGANRFNRPNYGTDGHSPSHRTKSHGNLLAVGLAAAIAIVGVAVKKYWYPSDGGTAGSNPVLVVRTQPSDVKLTLNKFELGKGEYVKASIKKPFKVVLPSAGQYTLRVKRPGYQSHQFVFEAKSGTVTKKMDIVLSELRKPAAVAIVLARPSDGPVLIDIENGYFRHTLRRKVYQVTPPDLFPNKRYKMRVYKSKQKPFDCNMKFKTTNWKFPTVVTIDVKRRRCVLKRQ